MSEQEKREAVIKGLEEVKGFIKSENTPAHSLKALLNIDDALALLKAQEPRVMTLVEVRALQDDTVVWLEDNDKTDVIPAIVNHAWNSLPSIVSFTLKNMREVKADMLWYGVKWRCWTSRPTDEQREATPWA